MSEKTCKTCRWFESQTEDICVCHRFPTLAYTNGSDWCGEWAESKVTDEHTFCSGFGVPLFKVTERENGTSTTEPIPDETCDEFDRLKAENAKLRELVRDMYCLAYSSTVEWEASSAAYDKYDPCEKCNELHGGKSPCAGTAKDMTEECCAPIQASVVADRLRELGIEVDELGRQKDNTGD